jgi:hypothetical protein
MCCVEWGALVSDTLSTSHLMIPDNDAYMHNYIILQYISVLSSPLLVLLFFAVSGNSLSDFVGQKSFNFPSE